MAFTAANWGQGVLLTGLTPSASITNATLVITKDNFPTSAFDTGLTSCLNGGGDWRFSTDISGTNQLDCEIVTCVTNATPASAEFIAWVKIPTYVSGSVDIYAFWNKAGESQPAASSTYGRNAVWSDLTAGWALNTGASESSLNGDASYDITEVGTITQDLADFQISPASANFNGAGHYTIPSDPFAGTSNFAVRGWIDYTAPPSDGVIGNFNGNADMSVLVFTGGISGHLFCRVANSTTTVTLQTTVVPAGTGWRHWAFRYDGANVYLDIDGDVVATAAFSGTVLTGSTITEIGRYAQDNARRLTGKQQQLLVSPYVTPDQIAIEYDNQSDPSTFWTTGAVFVPSGGANTSDIACTISPPTFSINSTNTAPTINSADIAYSVGSPLFTVNSTVLSPSFNSDVSFSITAPTFTSTGTVVNPAGATVSFTIDAPTFSANLTNVTPIFTSNIDFDISAPVFSIDANNGVVQRISNIDFTAPAPTFSADSTITIPDIEGDIAFSVSPPLFSVIAGTDADVYYYANGTQLALPTISRLIILSTKTRQVRV